MYSSAFPLFTSLLKISGSGFEKILRLPSDDWRIEQTTKTQVKVQYEMLYL